MACGPCDVFSYFKILDVLETALSMSTYWCTASEAKNLLKFRLMTQTFETSILASDKVTLTWMRSEVDKLESTASTRQLPLFYGPSQSQCDDYHE
ncbi:hypothetical protein EIP91_001246, partial [Steccherinum ochraceum]